jgi:hypothetical protein
MLRSLLLTDRLCIMHTIQYSHYVVQAVVERYDRRYNILERLLSIKLVFQERSGVIAHFHFFHTMECCYATSQL